MTFRTIICIAILSGMSASVIAQQQSVKMESGAIDQPQKVRRKAALGLAAVSGLFLAQQLFIQIPRWMDRPFDRHQTAELVTAVAKSLGAALLLTGSCLLIKPTCCVQEPPCNSDDSQDRLEAA